MYVRMYRVSPKMYHNCLAHSFHSSLHSQLRPMLKDSQFLGDLLTLSISGAKFKKSQSRFRSDSKKLHADFSIFVQDHDNPKFFPNFNIVTQKIHLICVA